MNHILISGFEPFGGERVNPSAEVARTLNGTDVRGVRLRAVVLPVDWHTGPQRLLAELGQAGPRALLMLGQSARSTALTLERVAVNLRSGVDAAGCEANDVAVVEGGPAAYFSTLPLGDLMRALREQASPATLSSSAGLYLCNAVFYAAMHFLEQRDLAIPAGFVHLPLLPEQALAKDPPPASMSLDDQARGVLALAAILAG
ncbi:MAG: pyroglutamyl-peptidase I [bacterium]|nr:pyroglutamyl-peptidase I [bacterium]